MIAINLLPWREEQREQAQKEFNIVLGAAAVLSIILMFLVHWYYASAIEGEDIRIAKLKTEISSLDKDIKEIADIKSERDQLLARMVVIQDLQKRRPLSVKLFDELVRITPSGVFYSYIVRKQDEVTIYGHAESNSEVSRLMRALEKIDWISNISLNIITMDTTRNDVYNKQFILHFSFNVPQQNLPAVSGTKDKSNSTKLPLAPVDAKKK